MRVRPPRRRFRQDGMVSTEFVAGAALLLLPAALLVALLPQWFEARGAALVAADQAARAAAVAVAVGRGAHEPASHAASEALAPHRFEVEDLVVRAVGQQVAVDLTIRMPALPLPWVRVGSFDWTATRTHPVDPYRSQATP